MKCKLKAELKGQLRFWGFGSKGNFLIPGSGRTWESALKRVPGCGMFVGIGRHL